MGERLSTQRRVRVRKLARSFGWSIVAWLAAIGLYVFILAFGSRTELVGWITDPVVAAIFISVVGGSFGILYGTSNLLADHRLLRYRSYGFIIGVKVVAMVAATLLTVFGAGVADVAAGALEADGLLGSFVERVSSRRMLPFLTYIIVVTGVLSFTRQTAIMVGPRVLWNVMRGRYHRPRSEERVFMFLDLKGSTTHAERLGHDRYCRLIQDCFRDLTDAAVRRDVEIYQYVGDEAVLTWVPEDGARDANCVRVFFDFAETLRRRAEHYEREYGAVPQFKAGVNAGTVMAAEIGVVKRDIVYLSEILHIAARIQGKCNELGQPLLVSRVVREMLPPVEDLTFVAIGEVGLRGRDGAVEIFGVEAVSP